jgi:beta-N-acetylhexosaminidase
MGDHQPSNDENAGRVLIVGMPGRVLPPSLMALARKAALGGVILFKRNLGGLDENIATIDALYDAWPNGRAPLVAIDQEGGRVARLGAPFVKLPPMRVLGEIDDIDLTRRAAHVLGLQLRALGIGLDFAPVLDVDTNPANPVIGDRSFGRDPEVVIRHALAFARGLGEAGVLSCGKHFPGHGDTELDSHLALPRIAHDRERLERVELAPFRAACGELPSIMTAHVIFDAIDPGVPATLSRRAIHGCLRAEIGYDGVIISDDLEMKAVADHWGVAESAVRAIDAGCDALLVCTDPNHVSAAHQALAGRADSEPMFAARLAEAAARIDALPRVQRPLRGAGVLSDGSSFQIEREIEMRMRS